MVQRFRSLVLVGLRASQLAGEPWVQTAQVCPATAVVGSDFVVVLSPRTDRASGLL